jgi:CelD/BcsL family acetyltransferase involved in cellulose biosynthesis
MAVEFDQEASYRLMGNKQEDKRTANKASLRRRYNYFRKSGDLRFRSCESESEILGYMETFFDQHIARRELTHSPSQFLDSKQHQFYRDLVRQLFPHGWLRFDVVLFDEAPIAFHFGFEYQNKFYWYKPTFDVRYAKRSPGEVLMKFLLEDAID